MVPDLYKGILILLVIVVIMSILKKTYDKNRKIHRIILLTQTGSSISNTDYSKNVLSKLEYIDNASLGFLR